MKGLAGSVKVVVMVALLAAMVLPGGVAAQEEGELPELALSAEGIAAVLAFALSLLVEIVPGFKEFWEGFAQKRLAWAIAGLVVALGMAGLDVAGVVELGMPEPFLYAGLMMVARAWLAFAGSGNLTYTLVSRQVAGRKKMPF